MSFLLSAGTATQTGMGLAPLSWLEIEAWARCSGLSEILTPYELGVIRKLSEAYTSEYSQASDKKRPQPWMQKVVDEEEVDQMRQEVNDKAKNVFAMLMKK